jgi:hypothetical protein
VERFNRTLAEEWVYVRLWTSERQRANALEAFLHPYNYHRHHTAVGGPPASRVNNLPGHYTQDSIPAPEYGSPSCEWQVGGY